MIYMVEMELPDRSREADWHAWYTGHITKLVTQVPGFHASQRFEAVTPTSSPFLALHHVDSGDVFESTEYKMVGGPSGTGEWRDLMTNWYRNLFDGLDAPPQVKGDQHLIVADDDGEIDDGHKPHFSWLTAVGLDKHAELRGIAVLNADQSLAPFEGRAGVRIFKPITARISASTT